MKVAWAHDHRFITGGGAILSESQFGARAWKRYLSAFDHVRVLGRNGSVPEGKTVDDLMLSSRTGVSFCLLPSLSGPVAHVARRWKVRRQIEYEMRDVDALIARLPSEIGLLGIEVARAQGIPWAVEVVACAWDGMWNYGSWQGKLYAPVIDWRVKRAVAKAPFALYVTDRFLQDRYPCTHGRTISCSNVEIPAPRDEILKARLERLGHSEIAKPLTFGLIGSLGTNSKGIHTALEALSHARDQLPPVVFRILGGGEAGRWEKLADVLGVRGLVRFDGTLPSGAPVLSWLDEIDVYLQPSLQEGLPRALIEAMSRGCPALGSTCGGIPELLGPECTVQPGDADHLGRLLVASADPAWQATQARYNWNTAKNYGRDALEPRREAFWSEFASYAKARQQA